MSTVDHITPEERLWIIEHIKSTPDMNLAMLSRAIKHCQQDMEAEDAMYMQDLNNLDFQQKLVETKLNTSPRRQANVQDIRSKTQKIATEHQTNMLKIDEEFKLLNKIKTVFCEMYDIDKNAQVATSANTSANTSSNTSASTSPIQSPRPKLAKSRSFLKTIETLFAK